VQEYLTREKIQRVLYLKNEAQHKIKEFLLVLGSLILIKNETIELSTDRKIKLQYLGLMIVIRQLKGGGFCSNRAK